MPFGTGFSGIARTGVTRSSGLPGFLGGYDLWGRHHPDRLDIRSYIHTAREHGKNAMDVLHDLMLGRPELVVQKRPAGQRKPVALFMYGRDKRRMPMSKIEGRVSG